MRKRGSIVCKLRPCLPKGPINSASMRTIVTVALQWQYLQTELILWIRLVYARMISLRAYFPARPSDQTTVFGHLFHYRSRSQKVTNTSSVDYV
jgi:hypothetical protein